MTKKIDMYKVIENNELIHWGSNNAAGDIGAKWRISKK